MSENGLSKRLRMKILAKRDYKCECCGRIVDYDSLKPELHRIDFNYSNNHESNLMVSCRECHKMIHLGLEIDFIRSILSTLYPSTFSFV
jgi:hypothetical protein